jgi:hypothetical protein
MGVIQIHTTIIYLNLSMPATCDYTEPDQSKQVAKLHKKCKIFSHFCVVVTTYLITHWLGPAISQAVSRWLPTEAARIRSRIWSSGICGGQSANLHSTKFSVIIITRCRLQ